MYIHTFTYVPRYTYIYILMYLLYECIYLYLPMYLCMCVGMQHTYLRVTCAMLEDMQPLAGDFVFSSLSCQVSHHGPG